MIDQFVNIARAVGTVAAILLAAYVLFRSRTPKILKEELDATRSKCTRLEAENKDLMLQVHEKDIRIAELVAKTDITDIRKDQQEIMKLMLTHNTTIMQNQ